MKIGDYVRTRDGYISKIKELGINVYTDIGCWSKDYVLKSSPNIIDLIEVGDYVNGVMVTEIKDGKPFKEDYNDPYYSYYFDDIYSIVTKEQFESMEYKIGE